MRIHIEVYWRQKKARILRELSGPGKLPNEYLDLDIAGEDDPEEAVNNLTAALLQSGKMEVGDELVVVHVPETTPH